MHAIQAIFVMQMVGCRQPGSADEADRLALFRTFTDAKSQYVARHMRIERRDIAAMLQDHRLAVAGLGATKYYFPVARCLNRCAARRRVVHTAVCPDPVKNRMFSIWVEVRAYTREIDRCANKRFADAISGRCKIFTVCVVINETNRLNGSSVVVELGCNNFTVRYVLAVLPDFLKLYVLVIALSDIEHEVDVPSEYASDVHDYFV